MVCTNQEYFVGNGPVFLRKVGDNCGSPTEGWFDVGDASELMINISQEFGDHWESRSGVRRRAARWINQTTADFTLSVNNFNATNLAALLQGTDSGAVVGASIVDESVANAYEGRTVYTAYPGMSAVIVKEGAQVLVLDTDYTLDTRNGGVTIITGAPNISGSGPITLLVSYTHVGLKASIEALTTGVQDYEIRFNGINLTASTTPVIVTIHRSQINAAEELSWIGQEIMSLTFTGAILPDANDNMFKVDLANAVS